MKHTELDSKELRDFLTHMITNNRHIQKEGLMPIAVELVGPSGLGKTSIILELQKELGLPNIVKRNLAQFEELGDLVGYPLRQFEMSLQKFKMEMVMLGTIPTKKKVLLGEPELKWVDENAIEQYTRKGYELTDKHRMGYCAPEWATNLTGGGILLLDDWNRADLRFIQAVMEIIDRQEYVSWKLPEDWHIILTANPDNGDYLVQATDEAHSTRSTTVHMKWSADRWAEWAEENRVDSRCINFVLMYPEIGSKKGVNARSLTNFFKSMASLTSFEKSLPLVQMLGEGNVGPEVSAMFIEFVNSNMDKMISPKEILLGKDESSVINAISSCIKDEEGHYKAAIASVLATRTVNFAINYAKDNQITPEIIERLINLSKMPNLFTGDLQFVMVKRIFNGNKQKFQRLLNDSELQEILLS